MIHARAVRGRDGIGQPVSDSRRRCRWGALLWGLLFALLPQALGAAENCFPKGKSVEFILPAVIGSSDNFYGRMIKTVAEDVIGSQFNVTNVPAKGGIEGMKRIYEARPSGRTLGMFNAADAIAASLAGAVKFTITDFSLFGRVADTPRAVFVSHSAFEKGLKDIQETVKKSSELRWGITTPSSFFASAVLNDLLGMDARFNRILGSPFEAAR